MDLLKQRTLRWTLAALAFASPIFAQPHPEVFSIQNESSGTHLSPGMRASINGSSLAGGTVTVDIGGRPAPVFERRTNEDDPTNSDVLLIQIPAELAPGATNVVVHSDGIASQPFNLILDKYAPGFDGRTYERSSGAGFKPYSCFTGETAKAGDIARIFAVGLGPTDVPVATGAPAPLNPLANTVVKPVIFVGGQTAEVTESALAPGEIGVYRVSFKVPPGDGWQGLSLVMDGKAINSFLPVGSSLTFAIAAVESITSQSACGGALTTAVPNGAPQIVADGDPRNPPLSLGGTTILVKDSKGVERAAPLLHVDPIRASYIIPAGSAPGDAVLKLTTGDGAVSFGTVRIQPVWPYLSFDISSPSTPAGAIVRVRNGAQTVEPLVQKTGAGSYQQPPIDFGPEGDDLYLVLFGSGWRFRGSLDRVRVTFGPNSTPGDVTYAGAQGTFAGLDQINVRLPKSLAGGGWTFVNVWVDDETPRGFSLNFK